MVEAGHVAQKSERTHIVSFLAVIIHILEIDDEVCNMIYESLFRPRCFTFILAALINLVGMCATSSTQVAWRF